MFFLTLILLVFQFKQSKDRTRPYGTYLASCHASYDVPYVWHVNAITHCNYLLFSVYEVQDVWGRNKLQSFNYVYHHYKKYQYHHWKPQKAWLCCRNIKFRQFMRNKSKWNRIQKSWNYYLEELHILSFLYFLCTFLASQIYF